MMMADEDPDIVELAERAKRLAEDTGRDEADILEDLMDDGILNMSHLEQESRLLKGMDTAQEAAKRLKEVLGTLIPVMLMVAAAGAEMFGIIDFTDAGLFDEEDDAFGPDPVVPIFGCTDPLANNFDTYATSDDGSCQYPPPPPKRGCTDSEATNHDPQAEEDDGSCEYPEPEPERGCTDDEATNYDPDAEEDDGSCEYPEPPPEEDCEVGIHNHYRGHKDGDSESNGVVIAFKVVPENCDGLDIKVDIELFQHGSPPAHTQQYIVSGSSEHDINHLFDGLDSGTWIPKIKASVDGEVLEDVNFWSIDIVEQTCSPEFSFYAVMHEWRDNNTTLAILWDADSSCEDEFEVEIDIVVSNNSTTVFATTTLQDVTGWEGDWKQILIHDLNRSFEHEYALTIWYDAGEDGWQSHAEHTGKTD